MSFVTAHPEMLATAADDLAVVGAAMTAQNSAAAW
ncbi:MAG: PE domain-containing protein [Mycobacterium sp.]